MASCSELLLAGGRAPTVVTRYRGRAGPCCCGGGAGPMNVTPRPTTAVAKARAQVRGGIEDLADFAPGGGRSIGPKGSSVSESVGGDCEGPGIASDGGPIGGALKGGGTSPGVAPKAGASPGAMGRLAVIGGAIVASRGGLFPAFSVGSGATPVCFAKSIPAASSSR